MIASTSHSDLSIDVECKSGGVELDKASCGDGRTCFGLFASKHNQLSALPLQSRGNPSSIPRLAITSNFNRPCSSRGFFTYIPTHPPRGISKRLPNARSTGRSMRTRCPNSGFCLLFSDPARLSRIRVGVRDTSVGMQVKNPQTKATKVNSEHHKVSESSSANAQRMRATNLPCHRQP